MSDPKPFASLSSGLLARKGAARPAMRPQGFSSASSNLDDLGWNDMGGDHPRLTSLTPMGAEPEENVAEHPRAHSLGLSPVSSPVHSQQAELADRLAQSEEDVDEDYDETAEPYEAEGEPAGFNGFHAADEEEEREEPEFKVQFKGGKKPLDLGPGPEAEAAVESAVEIPLAEEMLDLVEPIAPAAVPEPSLKPAPSGRAKAAFTLRLDPQRHLKLRLACAVRGCSAQQLVTDALDRFLGSMPELDELAEKARQRN